MKSILLVEHHPTMRSALRDLLQDWGYRVTTAANCHDALYLLSECITLDLLIVNEALPDIDGWALLRCLRADPLHKEIPFLMLGVVQLDPVHKEIAGDGRCEILGNAFTLSMLQATVSDMLACRRDHGSAE